MTEIANTPESIKDIADGAIEVRDEEIVSANTAQRVGSLFLSIAKALGERILSISITSTTTAIIIKYTVKDTSDNTSTISLTLPAVSGSTAGILTKEQYQSILSTIASKQDQLSAGKGISIDDDNKISVDGLTADDIATDENFSVQEFIDVAAQDISDNRDSIDELARTKQDKLISGTNIKTINNQPLLGGGNIDIHGGYSKEEIDRLLSVDNLVKHNNYLYEISYNKLDYAFANNYFNKSDNINLGGCSVVRRDNIISRNYDWLDNYDATFIVKTSNAQNHFATIGVAGSVPNLTIQKVDSRERLDEYGVLPFFLQDGINEKGLFAEINVVPYKGVSKTIPTIEKRESICAIALVRYILDNFESVETAIDYINSYVEVYLPQSLIDKGYELHYLLADSETTKVLEMDGTSWVAVDKTISTNFHLNGVAFNTDGSVPVVGQSPMSFGIDQYGSGLERYNILNAGGDIKDVFFTNAYTNTKFDEVWYSEFVGGSIDVNSNPSSAAFQTRIASYRQKYAERSKDNPQTWITAHSCEYDLSTLSLRCSVQEEDNEEFFVIKTLDERVNDLETDKQDKLISGTNIKTINHQSILGSGNITIQGGGGESGVSDVVVDGQSVVTDGVANISLANTIKLTEGLTIKDEYIL